MPTAAPVYRPAGYRTPEQRKREVDQRRLPRIRGRKLQELRKRCFQENPLCVACEVKGIVRAATQRDHIVALAKGGKDTEGNAQGLCDECHAEKTAKDLGHRLKQAIGIDGWPV